MLAHTCVKLPVDFQREFPIGGTALSPAQAQEHKMVRKFQVLVCAAVFIVGTWDSPYNADDFFNPMS